MFVRFKSNKEVRKIYHNKGFSFKDGLVYLGGEEGTTSVTYSSLEEFDDKLKHQFFRVGTNQEQTRCEIENLDNHWKEKFDRWLFLEELEVIIPEVFLINDLKEKLDKILGD